MTVAKSPQFKSFEDYLSTDPSNLPEGRYEYWDGDLIETMPESLGNGAIASSLRLAMMMAGLDAALVYTHFCEIAVQGMPRTRIPDLVVLEPAHIPLLARRATITRDMPPPRLIGEVASPGDENSDNYQRDYVDKPRQYAAINVPEYWIIDPDRAWVRVGVLVDGSYQFQNFTGNQVIASPTFPGLKLTAAQVLRSKI